MSQTYDEMVVENNAHIRAYVAYVQSVGKRALSDSAEVAAKNPENQKLSAFVAAANALAAVEPMAAVRPMDSLGVLYNDAVSKSVTMARAAANLGGKAARDYGFTSKWWRESGALADAVLASRPSAMAARPVGVQCTVCHVNAAVGEGNNSGLPFCGAECMDTYSP